MTEGSTGSAKVLRLVGSPPALPSSARVSAAYGPASGAPTRKRLSTPVHDTDSNRTTVEDLMHAQAAGQRGRRLSAAPPADAPPYEAVGVHAIPHKKRLMEPEHHVPSPTDAIQEHNMRYFNGAYRRHTHMAESLHKLNSPGVAASLSESAPPLPPEATFVLYPASHPRPAHRPVPDTVGRTLAAVEPADAAAAREWVVAGGRRPSVMKPDVAAGAAGSYFGDGVRDTLAGDRPATAEPFKYGWGVYGVHGGRQSSKGGSPHTRQHYYTSTLAGDSVASLLVHAPSPVRSTAPSGGGSLGAVPSGDSGGGGSGASERHSGGPVVSGPLRFAREIAGTASEHLFVGSGRDAGGGAPMATTYQATIGASASASASGTATGPRAKTPPRRQLAPVYGGLNDPYRPTGIY